MEVSAKAKILTRLGAYKPVSVTICLLDACASKCNMCEHWKWPKHQLDANAITNLLPQLKEMGTESIVFTGGEPFMYPSLRYICDHVKGLDMSYGILTSGIFNMDEETGSIIKDAEWVRFSIDEVNREAYQKIRGVDAFEKVFSNLIYAHNLNNKCRANITLQVPTLPRKQAIKEFFEGFNLPYKFWHAVGVNEKLHFNLAISESQKCHAIRYHCVIDSQGNVFPCCHVWGDIDLEANSLKEYSYGNIYNRSFYSIWNNFQSSAKARRLVSKQPHVCKRCFRYDEFNVEMEKIECTEKVFI